MSSAEPPVVRATNVVKRWGTTTVFAGASFTIGKGVTGLLGSNGAGKTTLIGMLLGFHRPDDGVIEVNGLDPTRAGPQVRARIGYSPEHHFLPAEMRAHDLVRHVAELHGLPTREAISRANDVLWQVGLGEERFRPVGTMSTGQRQRVKLAQAIAHDPALVLLDEPTDGLDPVQRDDMLALIRRVGAEFDIDILLSSHLLEEVERVCDAAVILARGTVAVSGALRDLTGTVEGLIVDVDGTDGDARALEAMLRERGCEVEPHDNGRSLTVRSPTVPGSSATTEVDLHDVVRDALVTAGVGVRRLTSIRVRLEDVFLQANDDALATTAAVGREDEL